MTPTWTIWDFVDLVTDTWGTWFNATIPATSCPTSSAGLCHKRCEWNKNLKGEISVHFVRQFANWISDILFYCVYFFSLYSTFTWTVNRRFVLVFLLWIYFSFLSRIDATCQCPVKHFSANTTAKMLNESWQEMIVWPNVWLIWEYIARRVQR